MTLSDFIGQPRRLADPAALDIVDAAAERFETPCGDGTMIWRRWGPARGGRPVVLLHGGSGSWAHWIRTIPALAADRPVWAADLPGYGESALPERPDDPASLCEAIAGGLARLLPAHRVDLVGFSLGGVLGAGVGVIAPGRLHRLVIVGSGGLDTPHGPMERFASIRGLTDPAALAAAHRRNLGIMMLAGPDSIDALAVHMQALNVARSRLNPGPFVLPDKLLPLLRRLTVPFSAIWGAQDAPHPNPPVQETVLRAIHPEIEFHVIPRAGHWCMYEEPEVFNRVLTDLLAAPPHPLRRNASGENF
jgi:pimeloyl-ACP methyl ester carboxylesterase